MRFIRAAATFLLSTSLALVLAAPSPYNPFFPSHLNHTLVARSQEAAEQGDVPGQRSFGMTKDQMDSRALLSRRSISPPVVAVVHQARSSGGHGMRKVRKRSSGKRGVCKPRTSSTSASAVSSSSASDSSAITTSTGTSTTHSVEPSSISTSTSVSTEHSSSGTSLSSSSMTHSAEPTSSSTSTTHSTEPSSSSTSHSSSSSTPSSAPSSSSTIDASSVAPSSTPIASSTSTAAASSAAPSASATATVPPPSSGFQSVDPDGNGPFVGMATYYDTDVGYGSCGTWHKNSDATVALSWELMDNWPGYNGLNPNNNPICGQKIKISYGGKSLVAEVQDTCPGCSKRWIDMSEGVFEYFATTDVGMLGLDGYTPGLTWEWVNPSTPTRTDLPY